MQTIWIYILVGAAAQLIDGTLGMAYGVSCNTFLRLSGLPTAVASACVHFAEVFTTLASGISHFTLKNIDKKLFFKLVFPGVAGGILGAFLLVNVDDRYISPVISAYLVVMGAVILVKAIRGKTKGKELERGVYPLALAGGLSDAMGGGGWGPIVTSTLLAAGSEAGKTIGTVNTAEFFVTLAESAAFLAAFAVTGDAGAPWIPVLGLIIGGVIAAPFAALLCKKVPVRPLLAIVGAAVILLNVYKLIALF